MKRFKVLAALTLVFTLLFATTAFAAVSPKAAPVVDSTGRTIAVQEVTNPVAVQSLSAAITQLAASSGVTANVKMCKDIVKPAGYVDGTPITFSWAVAGVADGATVAVFHYKADGTVEVVYGVVKNGIVTFTLTSLSPVAIVEMLPAAAPAAPAAAGGLHQTGNADYAGVLLAVALLSGTVMVLGRRGLKAEK